MRSPKQLISNWCELGLWDPIRSVSRNHVFLFQWTANGDNGADGHLARRHVEEAFRPEQGGLRNERKMVEATVETHLKIGVATQILSQRQRKEQQKERLQDQ